MTKQLYQTLLISGLIASSITLPSHAEEIYKHVDEKGAITFSDAKTDGAEIIIVEPVNIQPSPASAAPTTTLTTAEPDFSYTKLDITNPADQTTLRDEHKILIQAAVTPALRQDHQIEFLDNGQPLQTASQNSSIELTNFERGTHTLTARIIDKNNKVLKTSSSVTLYIFRTVVKPAPAPPPTPAP